MFNVVLDSGAKWLIYAFLAVLSLYRVFLFRDHVDCILPDSSVHWIFQASTLMWGTISYSKDLPKPGINPHPLCLLHWQADSGTLSHLGSPHLHICVGKCIPFFIRLLKSYWKTLSILPCSLQLVSVVYFIYFSVYLLISNLEFTACLLPLW